MQLSFVFWYISESSALSCINLTICQRIFWILFLQAVVRSANISCISCFPVLMYFTCYNFKDMHSVFYHLVLDIQVVSYFVGTIHQYKEISFQSYVQVFFLNKWILNFVKLLYSAYWRKLCYFLFNLFINYLNRFLNVEATVYSLNKTNLIMFFLNYIYIYIYTHTHNLFRYGLS